MSTRHVLDAHLVARPAPTATAMAWDLWWELSIDDGLDGAGPAGAASVTVPRADGTAGVTMWSDHADTHRLLRLDLPAGQTLDPDPAALPGAVTVDADAQVLLERVVGSEAVGRLRDPDERSFTTWLVELPSWDVIGRLALAHTVLAARSQPVRGLWALEIAHLLGSLDGGPMTEARREQLRQLAQPVLELLPASLLDRALTAAAPLGQLLLASTSAEGGWMGPLGDALVTRHAEDVVAAATALLADAQDLDGEHERGSPAGTTGRTRTRSYTYRGLEDLVDRGAGVEADAGPVVRVHLDHSIGGLVSNGGAAVAGDRMTIDLNVVGRLGEPPQALCRLEALVTDADGVVAASATFAAEGGHLTTTVRLPRSSLAGPLDVVIGRNLGRQPIDDVAFAEREAIHAGRQLAAVLRRSGVEPTVGVATLRSLRDPSSRRVVAAAAAAGTAWRRAGRPDQVQAIEQMTAEVPFAVELTGAAIEIDIDLPELEGLLWAPTDPGAQVLAAARDLAWSLGEVELAARLEAARFSTSGVPELSLDEHDALTLTLFVTGHPDVGQLDLHLPA